MKKSDAQLQLDVIDELAWEPSVDHAHIGVTVADGVVTLTGFVQNFPQKTAAEKAARRVSGVRAIVEEVKVRIVPEAKTTDHSIAKRIADVLEWNVLVPPNRVSVKVESGWVYLSGTVDWAYQRDEARKAASKIAGIVGVTNLIEVKNAPTGPDVKERIVQAFKRQAELDSATISVNTEGSKVKLGGKVAHWGERSVAERAA